MKKFYLKSMGCKSNQFEGQIVSQKLVAAGYEQVRKMKEAEYYILNSCSVTQTSDNEAMYLLRHAHNTGLTTILTGCIAQIEKEKLLSEPLLIMFSVMKINLTCRSCLQKMSILP